MTSESAIRRLLAVAALFNVGGSMLFLFPGSVGGLIGLPDDLPVVHAALLAYFVLLFGAMYGWLARQPTIDRPMVAFGAIGKAGAFGLVFVCWALGYVPLVSAVAFAGDLLLAGLLVWWLLASRSASEATVVTG